MPLRNEDKSEAPKARNMPLVGVAVEAFSESQGRFHVLICGHRVMANGSDDPGAQSRRCFRCGGFTPPEGREPRHV